MGMTGANTGVTNSKLPIVRQIGSQLRNYWQTVHMGDVNQWTANFC